MTKICASIGTALAVGLFSSLANADGAAVKPCAYGKAGFNTPFCKSAPDNVGSGPSLAQAGTAAEIRGGFLRGKELVFAFGGVFEKASLPLQGAIWSVDTKTGARKVLSGFSNDAAGGAKRTGSGPDLMDVFDVKPASGGALWVLSRGNNGATGQALKDQLLLMKVAPDGTRSVAMNLSKAGSPCRYAQRSLTVAPDGTLYAAFDYNGSERGIMKIDPAAGKCQIVSQTAPKASAQVGKGPETTTFRTVLFHKGSVYATDFVKNALWKIDPASGDRTLLSSSNSAGAVGAGPKALGTGWMTADGNTLWVSGTVVGNDYSSTSPSIVEVNLTNGARKTFGSGDGPTLTNDHIAPIWKEPGSNTLLVAAHKGIMRYQLDGDRNWVSYSSK